MTYDFDYRLIAFDTMLRQRLVRQSALNVSSSSEGSAMPSPQLGRRRRGSQESTMYRQLSTESLDKLLNVSERNHEPKKNGRRHSVACDALYVDIQKTSIKAAFNTAVRRMSSACSLLSSVPSSTYNLSPQSAMQPKKKEEEVMFPHVLGTFMQNQRQVSPNLSVKDKARNHFQVNRRFSTDCPPPSYSEATNLWKQPPSRHKLLTRQHEIGSTRESLVAVVDDDASNLEE